MQVFLSSWRAAIVMMDNRVFTNSSKVQSEGMKFPFWKRPTNEWVTDYSNNQACETSLSEGSFLNFNLFSKIKMKCNPAKYSEAICLENEPIQESQWKQTFYE